VPSCSEKRRKLTCVEVRVTYRRDRLLPILEW
jgi:hypothetical protein